eukprot:6206504-Pleurochrysis_carterae.AAC.2
MAAHPQTQTAKHLRAPKHGLGAVALGYRWPRRSVTERSTSARSAPRRHGSSSTCARKIRSNDARCAPLGMTSQERAPDADGRREEGVRKRRQVCSRKASRWISARDRHTYPTAP